MILNHSELDTQNLVVINLDRETVNFKKINFVQLNCVDSSPPPDCPAANQMPVEIMSQPAYAHQSVGQDSRSANSTEIHHPVDSHCVDIHHPAPAPVALGRIAVHALSSHPAVSSEPSGSSSSSGGGGDDLLPILNTPDSGINHSRNSLDGEMASSNRTPDDDRNSALPTGELTDKLNNDLNSNQLNDPISQLIKNGKMDYDREDRVHFDFLTASQLQKIVSIT